MPVFHDADFQKMAGRVVDRFLSRQAALDEAAADEAKSHQLNPDQIERLVQEANTQTFLRMMDQRKQDGASDMTHEFDPIDSRQVIRIVIDQNGVHIDGPHDNNVGGASAGPAKDHDELPDEMAALRRGGSSKSKGEKKEESKAEEAEEKGAEKKASALPAHLAQRKLESVAAYLRDKLAQLEFRFEDEFDTLAGRFRGINSRDKLAEFEHDVLDTYRDDYSPRILNSLRGALRLPAYDDAALNTKFASVENHITLDTPELSLFGNLVTMAKTASQLQDGIRWIEEQSR